MAFYYSSLLDVYLVIGLFFLDSGNVNLKLIILEKLDSLWYNGLGNLEEGEENGKEGRK